jgi:predicted small lipoprotein YifL
MKPFPAMARAGSALALFALSGCYYIGPVYYPYGYYPAVPTTATQHGVAAQDYGYPNGADAQNIPPQSPGGLAYVYPAPVYVTPAYYPAYYPPYPWYVWPGWWGPSVSFGFGYWGGGHSHWGGHGGHGGGHSH